MNFADAGRKVVEGTAVGLYEAGTLLLAESQPLVPVETGTLKRSGRVEEPVVEGDHVEVTVGYGYGTEYETKAQGDGDEAVGPGYGVYTHERLELKHKPPTQAKFLEAPAMAFGPQVGPIVSKAIKAKLST